VVKELDVSSLQRLGWSDFFQDQLGPERPEPAIARVVEEQRRRYRVAGDVDGWAEVSGRFRHEARRQADFPAVGDWVCTTALPGSDRSIIHRRLERRGVVSRQAAGRGGEEQVIAANVDTIFLVTAPTGDVNPRRLERYLAMVWEAGAVPVVVLNKSDLCDDPLAAIAELRVRLPLVEIAAVSALRGEQLDQLAPFLKPATTVAMLGSSGVGKSTLLNRLLGQDRQRVAAISETDAKGRHTTTSRQLIELPNGAMLIDTPGMRELQPWADAPGTVGGFEDLLTLAQSCRFGDCSHTTEPDCAVAAAIAAGTLSVERLDHHRQLVREAAFEERKRDKAAAAEEKRKWRRLSQQVRTLYKDRDRS
jgi:ribosome biogenesis GTPase